MSGRISTDRGPGTVWNYGPVPTYAADGTARQGHGRRSSIYRAQNSTLFSAFEDDERQEEGVPLDDLESDEEDEGRKVGSYVAGPGPAGAAGQAGEGRSLVGKKVGAGIER